MEHAAGGGLSLALPLGLVACADGDDGVPPTPLQARTLFVNLAHENHSGRGYWLTGGGRRYPLVPCAERPEVLERVRKTHTFLSGVLNDQITHMVEGAAFASDSVTLAYVSSDLDAQAGTWSMSSVQMIIPPAATSAALAANAGRLDAAGKPLLSAQRRFYGLPPAMTEQDLREERDLLDPISHAAALSCRSKHGPPARRAKQPHGRGSQYGTPPIARCW